MGRFLLLLVTRRWGWTLIAALIIAGGVFWGVSSPTIPYQSSPNTSYYYGATSNGDIYIWTTDKTNPTFFVARHNDFNPAIDATKIHLNSYLSFVARSDTLSVNQDLADNVHASQAHIIEKLVVYDTNQTTITATYTTAEYNANPNGAFDDRWWPGGSVAILAGLLVGYVALFVRRKKRGQVADQTTPGWPFVNIPAYPTAAELQNKKTAKP